VHRDTVGGEAQAEVRANAARQAPMVLGVVQLGSTMSNDTTPIFNRDPTTGAVSPVLAASFQQLRASRKGVQPLLQFDGCPTPIFEINSSSVPSPKARYYPMCAYEQLDELAQAFADYGVLLRRTDGLPTAWSFWPEPGHTLSDKGSATVIQNFECYLDFYTRVAPALRKALADDVVAGWQLNAANGKGPPRQTTFWSATQAFLEREAAAKTQYPVDYFTIQNYQGASSAELAANSRAAMCAEAGGSRPATGCSRRFALTPVVFVRFSENKDVDPNYDHKSGVSALLDELALTASLPDVAYVLHSQWESLNACATDPTAGCSPMATAALDFFRHRLPTFRAPVAIEGDEGEDSLRGLAAVDNRTQCFVLWSRVSIERTVDVTLNLRPSVAATPSSFELLTLGPKQKGFFPFRTVKLSPTASAITIPRVAFKENGVVAACIGINASADGPHSSQGLSVDVVVARHLALVPRGANDTSPPGGMGSFNEFHSAFTVASSGAGAASGPGLAGIVLRCIDSAQSCMLHSALCVELQLHQSGALGGRTGVVSASVRLDYLGNGSTSLMSDSFTAGPGEPWGGTAAAWPAAAFGRSGEFAFDAGGRAQLHFAVGSRAPPGWRGERRLRLSVLLRGARGPPTAVQAVVSDQCAAVL
jgi:hypothetical protein